MLILEMKYVEFSTQDKQNSILLSASYSNNESRNLFVILINVEVFIIGNEIFDIRNIFILEPNYIEYYIDLIFYKNLLIVET